MCDQRDVDDGSTVTVDFETGVDEPSTAVVLAVADATDASPRDLAPLRSAVEPGGLDALFADPGKAPDEVTFSYEGYAVTVRGSGEIVLRKGNATGAVGDDPDAESDG